MSLNTPTRPGIVIGFPINRTKRFLKEEAEWLALSWMFLPSPCEGWHLPVSLSQPADDLDESN
jgi:hypothetical protein